MRSGVGKMKHNLIVTILVTLSVVFTNQVSISQETEVVTVSVPRAEKPSEYDISYQLEKITYVQLEPREYLQVDRNDITIPSNATAEELDIAVAGTGLEGLGYVYIQVEKDYGINAIHLLSLTIWESGWGESPLATNKNNVSGFMAYDLNPYDSAKEYTCKSESIIDTAKFLSTKYTSQGVKSLVEIGKTYASDKNWSNGINSVSETVINRVEKNFGE